MEIPALVDVRERALSSVAELDPSITRFLNPHVYAVGLEEHLNAERTRLVLAARGLEATDGSLTD